MSRRTRVRQQQRTGRWNILRPRTERAWSALVKRWLHDEDDVVGRIRSEAMWDMMHATVFQSGRSMHRKRLVIFKLAEAYCLYGDS